MEVRVPSRDRLRLPQLGECIKYCDCRSLRVTHSFFFFFVYFRRFLLHPAMGPLTTSWNSRTGRLSREGCSSYGPIPDQGQEVVTRILLLQKKSSSNLPLIFLPPCSPAPTSLRPPVEALWMHYMPLLSPTYQNWLLSEDSDSIPVTVGFETRRTHSMRAIIAVLYVYDELFSSSFSFWGTEGGETEESYSTVVGDTRHRRRITDIKREDKVPKESRLRSLIKSAISLL
jgi:hypothetical protein